MRKWVIAGFVTGIIVLLIFAIIQIRSGRWYLVKSRVSYFIAELIGYPRRLPKWGLKVDSFEDKVEGVDYINEQVLLLK